MEYRDWLNELRQLQQSEYAPITLHNGIWSVIDRVNLWQELSDQIYDDYLENFSLIAKEVLSEIDPHLNQSKEEREASYFYERKLKFSEEFRKGIAETIALIGVNKDRLVNCSSNIRNFFSAEILRKLLLDTDWRLWASLNNLTPTLAEADPEEFLKCVEYTLNHTKTLFEELFSQESNGLGGKIYTTGLLWALESLAWSEQYLPRVLLILAELASIDPGGNWTNRPINSLKTILLPWFPQTLANKDKRISAIGPVVRDFPDIAWQVILAVLPNKHSTSSGGHKPKWRNPISEDFKQEVLSVDYWSEVTQYANLAVDMAEKDVSKLTQLAKEFDHLPPPAFERLNTLLVSDTVTRLSEEERAQIWKSLIGFTQKHRRFPDATWAMPSDILEKIELVAAQLAPVDLLLKYQRLFVSNDWELDDEEASSQTNWEKQREKLARRRADAIKEIFLNSGINSLYQFIEQVETPDNVGIALADFNNGELTHHVIPKHINDTNNQLKQFARGFVVEAFHKYGWSWVKAFDFPIWNTEQKIQFLTCLPVDTKTIAFVKEILGDDDNFYWKVAFINLYHTDLDLLMVADRLLEVKRIHSAINVLHHRFREGKGLDIERSVRALLSVNDSVDTAHHMSTYHIQELIKALQEDTNTPEEDLFQIEWFYVPMLNELHGNKPLILQKKLATEPQFFAELMRLMYKPNDAGDEYPEPDENKRSLATNAWQLLQNWKLPPGLKDGEFNPDDFKNWVDATKKQTKLDKRYAISMQEIGKVFYYYPEKEEGLWLPNQVAELIDGIDSEDIRIGYAVEIFNSRGIHMVDPEGKPELALALKWDERASIADSEGYPRFAAKLREVAESYRREAQRVIDEFSAR